MKRIFALLLILAVLVLPVFACADIEENPAGNTIGNNSEKIGVNSGTVINNLAGNGDIVKNDGDVRNNAGTVENNCGTVTNNLGAGKVDVNNGELTNNAGTVGNNCLTVTNNLGKGTVEVNNGEVTNNAGTIGSNNLTVVNNLTDASVEINNGVVSVNAGTVTHNNGDVYTNDGTVEANYQGALVIANRGTVGNSSGEIIVNSGTLNNNNGTVGSNEGTVTNNFSEIAVNEDTVSWNAGTVESNFGTVTDVSSGTVENNYFTHTDTEGTKWISILYEAASGSHKTGKFESDNDHVSGDIVTLLEKTFTRRGCTQTGWKDGSGKRYAFGSEYTFGDDSLRLLAVFKKNAPDYKTYIVTEGDEGVWDGSGEGLSFVIDAPFAKFFDVKAGEPDVLAKNLPVLDPEAYEAREGEDDTTVVTLLPGYLASIGGEKRIEFRFTDGAAYAHFSV